MARKSVRYMVSEATGVRCETESIWPNMHAIEAPEAVCFSRCFELLFVSHFLSFLIICDRMSAMARGRERKKEVVSKRADSCQRCIYESNNRERDRREQ